MIQTIKRKLIGTESSPLPYYSIGLAKYYGAEIEWNFKLDVSKQIIGLTCYIGESP